jgi:hypothetical protein
VVDAPDREGSATKQGTPQEIEEFTDEPTLTKSPRTPSNPRRCQSIDGYTGSQRDCGSVVSDTRLLVLDGG